MDASNDTPPPVSGPRQRMTAAIATVTHLLAQAARKFADPALRILGPALLGITIMLAWAGAPSPVIALTALLCGMTLGVRIGMGVGPRASGRHSGPRDTQRLVQDIGMLRMAFGVLQGQVSATIETSEGAVMAMMERLHRLHKRSSALHATIQSAVSHSQHLSTDSLNRSQEHGQALQKLAAHQEQVGAERQRQQQGIADVAREVRSLEPTVALVADISRHTNLLAINAAIAAARAGPEGAGFKVVATEVRRLSSQTADAARQISEGIARAAARIDSHVTGNRQTGRDDGNISLSDISEHMTDMQATLGELVPYMEGLSVEMVAGMQSVTTDVVDTLGDMQFQDINRQLLEQINSALGMLTEYFAQLFELIDGEAPPPPVMLDELIAGWTDQYVMQEQRIAHAQGVASAPARGAAVASEPQPSAPARREPREAELISATPSGARIELF